MVDIITIGIGAIVGAICGNLVANVFISPPLNKWADNDPKVDRFFDAFFERLGL